jgi:hypothetical protein
VLELAQTRKKNNVFAIFWGNPLTNTVQIRGDGKVIQIEVFGYERPDAVEADDANWLKARCSVTVADFSATLSLSLVAHDFARFAHELGEAVQLLKGTATNVICTGPVGTLILV